MAVNPGAINEQGTVRLGQQLRRARLAKNMTQGEVARGQFSVSYVSAVERGQIRPSLGALERLAERLQVPVIDLLSSGEIEIKGILSHGEAREGGSERFRDEIDNRLREARALTYQGRADDALTLLGRLSIQQMSSREAAMTRLTYAICYNHLHRSEDARREAQEGLAPAEKLGDAMLTQRLRNEVGAAYARMGAHALSIEQYRAAASAFEHAQERNAALDLTVNLDTIAHLGDQLWQAGEHQEAITYLTRAAELAHEIMNPTHQSAMYWAISQSYQGRGDAAQARLYALKSIAASEEDANRRTTAHALNRLGRALAQEGQIEAAREQLQAAFNLAAAQQDARSLSEAQRSLALVALNENHLDDAEHAAQDSLARARALDSEEQVADALLVVAQVAERRQRAADAERHFEEAITLLQQQRDAEALRRAYEAYSEFLERKGDSARAFEMLKNAYRSTGRPITAHS